MTEPLNINCDIKKKRDMFFSISPNPTSNRTAQCFVNLGEEVILTLLQSGASESATVSMFCY